MRDLSAVSHDSSPSREVGSHQTVTFRSHHCNEHMKMRDCKNRDHMRHFHTPEWDIGIPV